MSSGVIIAISIIVVILLLVLIICVIYCKKKNIGKRHVMYYKDMSKTPLEEDFDLQPEDLFEKAKIMDEETWTRRDNNIP
jgi:hypothetical protein